jgi:hypothetical protein
MGTLIQRQGSQHGRGKLPQSLADDNTNEYLKLSIAGRDPQCLHKGTFIGSYANDDFAARKKSLEKIIANYVPQELPCPYDPSLGRTDCFNECVSWLVDGLECPEQRLSSAERELSRLKMREFLVLAFSSPSIARANDLLNGDLINSDL